MGCWAAGLLGWWAVGLKAREFYQVAHIEVVRFCCLVSNCRGELLLTLNKNSCAGSRSREMFFVFSMLRGS